MSIAGERDGISVEMSAVMRSMAEQGELFEEYREGDPPTFQVASVEEPENTDDVFYVTTSTGNRFKISVEVAE